MEADFEVALATDAYKDLTREYLDLAHDYALLMDKIRDLVKKERELG